MTGLDTNVLIRYLTEDDAAQTAKAARIIESAAASTLFVGSVVLCEVVWVLEDCYSHGRKQIAEVIEKMLLTAQFVFQDKDVLWQALADYRTGRADLADYVIGRTARRAGCQRTVTFDRALKDDELFRVL